MLTLDRHLEGKCWEYAGSGVRPSLLNKVGQTNRELTVLFNATTLITLTIGALSFFAALFVLTLAAAGFLIDAGVLGETIGRPAGAGEFVALALMTSSLAMLGGTLGSGLETSDDVHEAAYTYHRERRHNEGQSQDGSG